MANYDRRILVPYLQDVCTAELMCAELEKDIQKSITEYEEVCIIIDSAMPGDRPSMPVLKKWKKEKISWVPLLIALLMPIGILLCGALAGVIFYFLNLRTYGDAATGMAGGRFAGGLVLVIGFFVWICYLKASLGEIFQSIKDAKYHNSTEYRKQLQSENERQMELYEARLRDYENKKERLYARRAELPKLIRSLKDKHTVVECMRSKLYAINVIPSQYRNIYAAYYLYDFMSTSRETDLEKVIQTFVLEEIKQRLDKIIMQNNQVLINQRVQLAMQEQQNRMVAENHREEMRNIARLEANQERQLDYQKMIAANQEVTNYILAEDYFRKYDKRIPY